jgi:hypothetical protein
MECKKVFFKNVFFLKEKKYFLSFAVQLAQPTSTLTVTLSDFYSYRLIGKLTAFLQFQEFSQRNQTWESRAFTFAA